MSIYIKNKDEFEKPDPTVFEKEEVFGNLIIDYPEIFPIGKFTDFAGSKWIPIAVEMQLEYGLGRLDVLGIDGEGCIYIIENKLYKNYQKKTLRQQGTDYAFGLRDLKEHHNGWEIFKKKIKSANKSKWAKGKEFLYNKSLEEIIKKFKKDEPEDYQRCLDEVKNNFEQGNYTLVVAMDRIPPGLRISISGHNEIDAKHEVPLFALEVNQFFDNSKEEIIVVSTYPYDLEDLKHKNKDKTRRGENTNESFQKYYEEKSNITEGERKDFDEFRQEIEKLAEEEKWYGRSETPQIYAKFGNIGGGEKHFVQISADGNLRFLFENFDEFDYKHSHKGKPTKESELLKEKFETNPALKEALWTNWKKSNAWGMYNKPKEWMPVWKEIIKVIKEVEV